MAHVLIRHRVSKYDEWKEAFENFADVRKSAGEVSYQVMQHEEDSDNLYVLFEWDTVDKAREFLGSTRLRDAMQSAGVTETPEIQILKQTIKGTL
jgi:quinol monooxygenase YgiN